MINLLGSRTGGKFTSLGFSAGPKDSVTKRVLELCSRVPSFVRTCLPPCCCDSRLSDVTLGHGCGEPSSQDRLSQHGYTKREPQRRPFVMGLAKCVPAAHPARCSPAKARPSAQNVMSKCLSLLAAVPCSAESVTLLVVPPFQRQLQKSVSSVRWQQGP